VRYVQCLDAARYITACRMVFKRNSCLQYPFYKIVCTTVDARDSSNDPGKHCTASFMSHALSVDSASLCYQNIRAT